MEAAVEITAAVKNVPALRFPEFEGEWIEKKLKEVAKVERGRFSPRPRNNPIYYTGNIPFVQTSDVVNANGKISVFSQTLNEKGLAVSKLFPKGTILITIAANIGHSGVLLTDMACPDSLVGISPKRGIDNYFLNFYLSTQQKRMDYLAPEGAQRNINIEFLNPYPVPITTLSEQQKIASFLSAVDDKIQQLSKKKALLKKYKKGVMQQLFSQQIRFKDDNGNDFPEWEIKKAKEVFKNHSNKKHNGDLPILAITQDKGTVLRDSIDIDIKSSEASIKSYKIIEKGDFIISLRSFQGGIEYSEITGICSPAYTVLKATIDIDTTFFKYYFKKESFIKQLSNTVVGIRDGKQISYDAFSGMKLIFPSVAEQSKMGEFITSIDNKINFISTQLEQAIQYKKGLLQQLFV
jgi:type I restriction enzyme, S subunit